MPHCAEPRQGPPSGSKSPSVLRLRHFLLGGACQANGTAGTGPWVKEPRKRTGGAGLASDRPPQSSWLGLAPPAAPPGAQLTLQPALGRSLEQEVTQTPGAPMGGRGGAGTAQEHTSTTSTTSALGELPPGSPAPTHAHARTHARARTGCSAPALPPSQRLELRLGSVGQPCTGGGNPRPVPGGVCWGNE